ncbi:hypothetical protein D0866_16518, partial [Hortaea werneckii]
KPDIEALGGNPIVQSIEESSVSDLSATIQQTQSTTVVWSAGAGGGNPERTRTVDHEGAIKSMDATAQAGVKRYIIVSAVDVRDRENRPEPEWYDDGDRDRSSKVWNAIGKYMVAKLHADRSLVTENARRGLDYTIVRPGGLSQEAGMGRIAAGKVHLNTTIPREDVAATVVQCLKDDGTIGLAFDIVGGETGITDAVAEVARGKIDTTHFATHSNQLVGEMAVSSVSSFRSPSKENQPLHALSPEHAHNSRTPSSQSMHTMNKTDSDTDTAFPPPEPGSSHSSPSRRQASHLCADYRPTTPNGQHSTRGFTLPQSPSLPEMHAMRGFGHARTNSDVQGLVKRFEHLDVRDKEAESKEKMKRHEAELKRAMIAREEAESDVRRFREEVRRLRKERDEGGDRERRVARRLETVMHMPKNHTPRNMRSMRRSSGKHAKRLSSLLLPS